MELTNNYEVIWQNLFLKVIGLYNYIDWFIKNFLEYKIYKGDSQKCDLAVNIINFRSTKFYFSGSIRRYSCLHCIKSSN